MKPLQISPETALKLSKSLNLPLEQIMHMPTPVLLKKLAEAEAKEKGNTKQLQESAAIFVDTHMCAKRPYGLETEQSISSYNSISFSVLYGILPVTI